MNIEHVKAIFLLAGMDILSIDSDENPYWGSPRTSGFKPETYEWAGPRWLVRLKSGAVVKIHRRKHVFDIDWESTPLRFPMEDQFGRDFIDTDKQLTNDSVTQSPTNVHADSFGKCIDYLQLLARAFERNTYLYDFRRRAALGQLTSDELTTAQFYAAAKQAKSDGASNV